MKNTLSKFSEAVQAYSSGDKAKAAESLSRVLASDKTLPAVESSLKSLINPSEPMGDAMLRIMISEEQEMLEELATTIKGNG